MPCVCMPDEGLSTQTFYHESWAACGSFCLAVADLQDKNTCCFFRSLYRTIHPIIHSWVGWVDCLSSLGCRRKQGWLERTPVCTVRASKLHPEIQSRLSRDFTEAGRVQTACSSPEDQGQWLLLDASQAVSDGLMRGNKALFAAGPGDTGSASEE